MSSKTDTRLTHGQRLARGLTYTAVGPVDVTRGAVGLSVDSLGAAATELRRQYRKSAVRRELRKELASAQETVSRELTAAQAAAQETLAELPDKLRGAARRRRSRKTWLLVATGGAVVLAGGAVAFTIVRRSTRPEPSPLPPSVQVDPKP
ncbi:cell wall synthesis protein CwsA [Mycolicibacterium palauense]|uniref:cell wall synthesis protein CwsA n=1 Tax=Mycolicibacterium palauense TaxID=2034511 RepID=UPI000BFEB47B|nr:cell wall synthesis protein CwsA [Mycolicibacterium palauense]